MAVQNPDPFEVHPIETEERSWQALLSSVAAHLLIILMVLLRPFPSPEAGPVEPDAEARPIAIDQRTPFEQPTDAQPRPVQVPEDPVALGPDSERPEDPIPREAGPETPPTEAPDPTEDPPADPEDRPIPPSGEAASRIATPRDLAASGSVLGPPTSPFGRPSATPPTPTGGAVATRSVGSMGRLGVGSRDTRSWRQSFPEATGQCVEIPDLGRNPDGTPVLASVSGIVRDQAGRPLPGAHLIIVGSGFATFSDGSGRYRLEFDPALLQRCRVQIVRVQAEGYRTQDLHLAIGRNARSDDVLLRRR